jgi:hypothetical protein
MEGHEASEGDKVRVGDLVEQLAGISYAAEISVAAEDFAGNRLLVGVETMDNGQGVDSLELS